MCELPAVLAVMSIACSSGTPLCTRPEKVRDQRASAILWITSPIFAGSFSLIASHCQRPHELFFHFWKPITMPTVPKMNRYHCPRSALDAPTLICVMKGSLPSKSAKTSSNTGIRKATSASSTTSAKMPIIIG